MVMVPNAFCTFGDFENKELPLCSEIRIIRTSSSGYLQGRGGAGGASSSERMYVRVCDVQ